MAKRLNKKVAIISSLILAVLIMAAIVVILKLSKDPHKYISDAQTALALAEPDYETAKKAYGQAFACSKDMDLKIDILFKLAEMYEDMNEWSKVAGCWNSIINYDTKNKKARLALLDYSYQIATAGNWTVWKDIESNVSELMEEGLDTSSKMYRIKGQALAELVRRGQKTDKETAIKEAIENLQKANQAEPNNVDIYQYLADAIMQQGEIIAAKGILDAAENARQESAKILLKGVETLPDEPKAHINFYSIKLAEAEKNPDKYEQYESDLIGLTGKFGDSPLPFFALVQLYQSKPKDTDKAIAAVEKARELDRQNVSYAATAANLYYRRHSIRNSEDDFQKAIDIAKEALSYSDSLDMPGPKARVNFINRYTLHSFLINCFIEKAAKIPDDQPEKSRWLESAEKELYEIDQLLGSAENVYATMWRGRLLFAQGKTNEAIVQMNAAYKLLTASGQNQRDIYLGQLSYELARALHGSAETGAIVEFYSTAMKNGLHLSKPQVLLDFASVLMLKKDWKLILEAVDFFETNFTKNEKSTIIRIGAYIGTGMFEQAQELLDRFPPEDPNKLKLEVTLLNNKLARTGWELAQDANGYEDQLQKRENYENLKAEQDSIEKKRDSLMDKLVLLKPAELGEKQVTELCKKYISEGQADKVQKLVGEFLHEYPNSVNVKLYQFVLAEPAPANVPPERLEQLTISAIESLDDPVMRASLLGEFYQEKEQTDEAVKYFQQVLQIEPGNNAAITELFNIAISNQDFKQAEELTESARQNNSDLCEGEFFKAQLAFIRKEYQKAIQRIDSCLEKRPIFSRAYLLRSRINTSLEKESDAMNDIKKAYELNPLDGLIARNRALLLYNRDQKLGASVSADQLTETRSAIEDAIRTNPTDYRLKSFYAEYIGSTDPQRAIAICQQIQKVQPSVENLLILGRLALKLAEQYKVEAQKKMYISIAENSYKSAYESAPEDARVLAAYGEFLRTTGKVDDAEKILASQDSVLWRFYLRNGEIDNAQQVLEKLYESNPDDVNTIKGLLIVFRNKKDQTGILKYTDELIKKDNSIDNQIIQIESYLEIGLTDDAQVKLDSLRERSPDEPKAMFLDAWLFAKQGKFEEALNFINKALELDKTNPRAWRLRGQINLGMNNLNGAIDDLQKSKTLQDDPEVRIDLARAYIQSGKVEQAIVELKVAVDEQGSFVGRKMLEEIYYATGKREYLEKFYAETLQKFPNDVYWYNRAGQFALRTGNFDEAYKLFDTAFQNSLKINSELPDAEAFDGRMRALLNGEKYDQLSAEATKYLDSPLAPIAYTRMAFAKAKMGDKDTAVQYFRRALEKAATNENYIIEILKNMSQVVGLDETVKWCNEKLQSQPDSIVVNFAMFNLCKITGEYDKAIEHIDNCIRIAADNEQLSLTYQFSKATMLQTVFDRTADRKYLEEAVKEYESLLQKQPTNTAILNNLAYTLASTDTDIGKALEYAKRAYKALPNNASVLDTYGYVLLKNGKTNEADEFLQRALQQYEQDQINAPIDVYEHIGMAKEALGQNNEALQVYRRAIEVAGKNISQEVKSRISAAIERISSQ